MSVYRKIILVTERSIVASYLASRAEKAEFDAGDLACQSLIVWC